MVFPDQNLGIAGFSIDEQDLFQVATDLHARPIRETSLKEGRTVKYSVPKSKLDGSGPYELSIPSMAASSLSIQRTSIVYFRNYFGPLNILCI